MLTHGKSGLIPILIKQMLSSAHVKHLIETIPMGINIIIDERKVIITEEQIITCLFIQLYNWVKMQEKACFQAFG